MIKRLVNHYRVWRSRGTAKLNHALWLHWVLFGKYPALAAGSRRAKTPKAVECEASQSGGDSRNARKQLSSQQHPKRGSR